ncbi:MAG: molybdopterin cofactor-binding domain-containing protein [Thiohalorhabdus sp.]|uniref:molybdopterin cofactor-binding domain-containing protein n=1 Tax=Thiohalorhabdus sp. TaxID=3094134 RepID=UPI00397F0BDF
MIELTVNGRPCRVEAGDNRALLWALRHDLGLKGTKYGCGVGVCGACVVQLDGAAVHACTTSLAEARGRAVTTIEGLAADPDHPVLRAWLEEQVPQCGFCQPAQEMAAAALLARRPEPTEGEVDTALGPVLCRCGTYLRIRRAVHRAARHLREGVSAPSGQGPLLRGPGSAPDPGVVLNPWVRVHEDDTVALTVGCAEMGQGALTGQALLLAEELEVDPAQVRVKLAPAHPDYTNPLLGRQVTGGSTSVRGAWGPLRRAGAAAREVLVRAAAERWEVAPNRCRAESGGVLHPHTGRRLGYGELAHRAVRLHAPRNPVLKSPERFRLVGRSIPRFDAPDMVTGRTVYGQDVDLPGMRVAVVRRSPTHGGRLRGYDVADAAGVPGFHRAVPLDHGVAVVAADFPAAEAARDRLRVDWDPGPMAGLGSTAVHRRLREGLERPGEARAPLGRAEEALRVASRVVEADYATPYLAHMPLEPMNCTARVEGERCEVWVGTQAPGDAREAAAEAAGLPPERVQVHSLFLGGGFGRRLQTDFVREAVAVARHVDGPVQVLWTRADDTRHDFYRPGHAARLRAALDDEDRLEAWWMRLAGPRMALGGISVPYDLHHYREERVEADPGIPTGPWRSVEASNNAFALESFLDELAAAAGQDPLTFRLDHLTEAPRHRAVLEEAAQRAGWGRAAAGRHQGLAVYRSFGSIVAEVVELAVDAADRATVYRVTVAIDCGRAVQPDGIRAQMEGAVAFALSAALRGGITFADGATVEATYADQPILTLPEMPAVEVAILEGGGDLGGVGEPGVPPLAPAAANAVCAATGRRIRDLPLVDGEGRLRKDGQCPARDAESEDPAAGRFGPLRGKPQAGIRPFRSLRAAPGSRSPGSGGTCRAW